MKVSFLFVLVFFVSYGFAINPSNKEDKKTTITHTESNDGSILKGTVIEESTGKPLPLVNVNIEGTNLYTTTDVDGNFSFRKLKSGKYNVKFSFFSFETKIISDVEVVDNEATTLTVSMSEMNGVLDEVIIRTVKAKTESVQSLLTMQKNSIRVSDGISAESIKRTPDKTTSDVLKRISGASVQDNKFVIVRGLNERYNTSYLNGAPLPSSEPDRKAFSFDIFPANMIDNLVIYKTASPDLPGEFAGGVIEINTKATPDKNFQTVSVGGSYNTITTGKDRLVSSDTKAGLPSSFPSVTAFQEMQSNRDDESNFLKIANLAKEYQTDWSLKNKTFSPNTSFQYTLGRYFKLKEDKRMGMLFSLTNNVSNDFNEIIRRNYETPGVLGYDLLEKSYSTRSLFAAIGNVSLKFNARNTISFKNLYSVNTENRVMDRDGSLSQNDPLYSATTSRLFSRNKIYSGQLIGEHFLPDSKIKINWVGSYNSVNREVPNERRNTYIYIKNDDGTFTTPSASFTLNNVGSDYPGSIYSSKNVESIYSAKVDLSKKVDFSDHLSADIKVGALTQTRNRNFQARQMGYVMFNGFVGGENYGRSTFLSSISNQGNETIFNASNMGILGPRSSGLTLYDGTSGTDSYTAESKLDAAYVMLDNAFNKFRIIWGARLENYSQKLHSKTNSGKELNVDDSQLDILPSINFIYSINKKQNIRLSGSKTLNRPEFRELAPFVFYDAQTKFNTEGDTLKIVKVTNVDLRYEIFPGKGQVFSISTFYKHFLKPIELLAKANNTNQYKNAKSGQDVGVEIEYRTLLSSMFGSKDSKILDDLTFYTNLAVIRSKVDISNLVQSATLVDTPMQGQSPYVFNAGLQYMNKEKGWSSALNLNKIGSRIAIHGNQTTGSSVPAYWEKSRAFLDYQLAKTFLNNKLELKLNIQNILAQDLIVYQNNDLENTPKIKGLKAAMNSVFNGDSQNKDGYNSKEDDLNWSTKFGRTFSLTLNYNF